MPWTIHRNVLQLRLQRRSLPISVRNRISYTNYARTFSVLSWLIDQQLPFLLSYLPWKEHSNNHSYLAKLQFDRTRLISTDVHAKRSSIRCTLGLVYRTAEMSYGLFFSRLSFDSHYDAGPRISSCTQNLESIFTINFKPCRSDCILYNECPIRSLSFPQQPDHSSCATLPSSSARQLMTVK